MGLESVTSFDYINLRGTGDEVTANGAGGVLHLFTADTTTLLVGDIVYLSGVGIVNKSATASNYVGYIGVVVGGQSNGFRKTDAVGTTAALSGEKVMVQVSGIARCIVGATGFTAGVNFNAVPSAATAGRVIPGTTADQRVGVATTTQATAGSEVLMLIVHF